MTDTSTRTSRPTPSPTPRAHSGSRSGSARVSAASSSVRIGPCAPCSTDDGAIETEHVVNAAGIWAPQVAAMVGAFVPSVPVDHQHVAMAAVTGHEVPRDLPCFRDPDNLIYGKAEAGGLLIGGYEPDPPARWVDGVPWEHGASPVQSDMDRFTPLLQGAIRRFPFLEDAGVMRLLCHPDAMTPGRQPAARADAGPARLLARGGPVAERVRRRRRTRQEPGGVDHLRRQRTRRRRLPAVALRTDLPRRRGRQRDRQGGLQVLLPAALSAGHQRGRTRAPAEPAASAP